MNNSEILRHLKTNATKLNIIKETNGIEKHIKQFPIKKKQNDNSWGISMKFYEILRHLKNKSENIRNCKESNEILKNIKKSKKKEIYAFIRNFMNI